MEELSPTNQQKYKEKCKYVIKATKKQNNSK